ncbi:MAG: DUF4339 domain-containing protein [Bacteroidales bacterium]
MKEYFFLKGKEQNGPFSLEELSRKDLTNETLIWTDGMENWHRLKDIPELVLLLKPKSVPPPQPTEDGEQNFRTEISGHLKVTSKNTSNPILDTIKPSRRALTRLIAWCGFHLFALLMSYSEVSIFNNNGREPKPERFWPFVDFIDENARFNRLSMGLSSDYNFNDFHGILTEYDWTEFAFYVGGAMVVFLLVQISKKKEGEDKIKDKS